LKEWTYAALGFKNQFGYNLNFMVFLILGVYMISLILLLLSFWARKSLSRKFMDASIILAREIALSLVVFSSCNTVISYFIEYDEGSLFQSTP